MSSERSILVVGGGTAGWLTACRMAKMLGSARPGAPSVTLIESPEIGTIGVGEGTFPTIKTILQSIGIDEARFMRESSATFKQGIKFADWVRTPENGVHSHYLHPFENPWGQNAPALAAYWLLLDEKARPQFADTVTFQQRVTEAQRAPKLGHEGDYKGPLQYAYHLDALKFARLLTEVGAELGVRHLKGTVDRVDLSDDGAIAAIHSPEHGELTADMYIDCTGQRAELIGKALKVPFKRVNDVLFTDRAVACQVPYDSEDQAIESYTVSTAHEAGWTWDIGLNTRRGIGYVYSSNHTTDEAAEARLRAYVGPKSKDVSSRVIKFDAGYREQQWVKNCVAVGLSAGFFEPLESTGIVLIEIAAGMLAELFTFDGPIDGAAARFNTIMKTRCENITNFIKLHYCVTKRTEPFWRDNADGRSIPDALHAMLDMWKYRPPSRFDFMLDVESFSYFSYQYILYGMEYRTEFDAARQSVRDTVTADQIFKRIQEYGEQAVRDLPSHRALIDQVYTSGFTPAPDKLMSVNARR